MTYPSPTQLPAIYARGGTSKGVFFKLDDLPLAAQQPGAARDQLLLRIIGSPDPYGKQIDGMGGATSSTSKVVILSKSSQPGHDVDYLFGQVSIDQPLIDWSGNCGNLTAAVGLLAMKMGLIDAPTNTTDTYSVRIWQANTHKTLVAHLPIVDGQIQEVGDFVLDGVAFPAPEIAVDFLAPTGDEALFPTGQLVEALDVPNVGQFEATMINAGIPTVFLNAEALGYEGTELQTNINNDPDALARFETIRAHAALKMGLITSLEQAKQRQHTPKIAFVAAAKPYTTSSGKTIQAHEIDLLVRALSMGKLHHAMMGTAAVAIGTAAVIPGTLVNLAAGGDVQASVTFGHPSGTLKVGAVAYCKSDAWQVESVSMSRSARLIMQGQLFIPPIDLPASPNPTN